MTFRPDNLSLFFILGVGPAFTTRGLGSGMSEPEEGTAVVHGKDGGPAPVVRASRAQHPTVLGADVGAKKKGGL
jgi:hypothetical protein